MRKCNKSLELHPEVRPTANLFYLYEQCNIVWRDLTLAKQCGYLTYLVQSSPTTFCKILPCNLWQWTRGIKVRHDANIRQACSTPSEIPHRSDSAKRVHWSTRCKSRCISFAYENGIMLGAPPFILLTDRQLRDIKHWISTLEPDRELPESLPSVANSYSRTLQTSDFDLASVP